MKIVFKQLRYKNILSTGNVFTTIQLDSHPTTLIQGVNGAGKSTMIEALHFVLFNSAYRNITKPSLVNSINKKELLVEVDFSIGNTEYTVRRGIKPNVFDIIRDGVSIDQVAKSTDMQVHLEKDIIKMDSTAFKQLVVMGTASYVPFMQLKTPQRRQIIEELLDIQVIGLLSKALKKDVSDNKDSIMEAKSAIQILAGKIDSANDYNARLRQAEAKSKAVFEEAIAVALGAIQVAKQRREVLLAKMPAIEKSLEQRKALEKEKSDVIQTRYPLAANLQQANKVAEFFLHSDNCPTCKQKIGEAAKSVGEEQRRLCESIKEQISKIDAEVDVLNDRINALPDANGAKNMVNMKVAQLDQEIDSENRKIDQNKKQIEDANKSFEYIDNDTISGYQSDKAGHESAYEKLMKERDAFAILTAAFKDDGVKTLVIRKYIPIINELINRYLSILDFFVEFELNESFEETIKSRHRDTFTYESFSEGEKAKISTAILFTWRHLTKLRNSTSTNLLILDEVFDGSMDSGATSGLMKILKEESEIGGTNSFVISHRSEEDLTDFDRYLKFEKVKNFSSLSE